jgi:hypothetical protein
MRWLFQSLIEIELKTNNIYAVDCADAGDALCDGAP